MLIDTHTHLDFSQFEKDLTSVIDRASQADVRYMLNISTDPASIVKTLKLTEKYENIYAAVGLHPHEADKINDDDIQLVRVKTEHPKVKALGEVGLDFYRDYADHDNQRKLFRAMIDIASEKKLPLVIHNRAASEETLRILKEKHHDSLTGVFHCFAGDADFADEALKMGFYISFAGNLTFNKSHLAETAGHVPIERILLETDCPFLAPQSRRGKRSEPADVKIIAEFLAKIKELSPEDIARITSYNAFRLFGIGPEPEAKIVYPIRDSLYINLTNRCSSDCVFCPRSRNPVVKGHNLKLQKEPEFSDIVKAVEKYPAEYHELVFCGYGEPSMRFDLVMKTAKHFRGRFKRLRLDTNGHGNLINKRDIVPEISAVFDAVSISLNSPDPAEYQRINRPDFADKAFPALIGFIRKCAAAGLEVAVTVVGFPGADIEGSRRLAKEMGAGFRVRKYNDLG